MSIVPSEEASLPKETLPHLLFTDTSPEVEENFSERARQGKGDCKG